MSSKQFKIQPDVQHFRSIFRSLLVRICIFTFYNWLSFLQCLSIVDGLDNIENSIRALINCQVSNLEYNLMFSIFVAYFVLYLLEFVFSHIVNVEKMMLIFYHQVSRHRSNDERWCWEVPVTLICYRKELKLWFYTEIHVCCLIILSVLSWRGGYFE